MQTEIGLACPIAPSGLALKGIVREKSSRWPELWAIHLAISSVWKEKCPEVIILIPKHRHWKIALLFNQGPERRKSGRLGSRNSEEEAFG